MFNYNFEIKISIVTKFAAYVAWILLCKNNKLIFKIYYSCEDIEFS